MRAENTMQATNFLIQGYTDQTVTVPGVKWELQHTYMYVTVHALQVGKRICEGHLWATIHK